MVWRSQSMRSRHIPGGSGGFATHRALSAGVLVLSTVVETPDIVGDVLALAIDMCVEVFGGTKGGVCVSDTAQARGFINCMKKSLGLTQGSV